MKQIIFYILSLVFFASCASSKKRFESQSMVQIDTIYKDRIIIDTIFKDKVVYIQQPFQSAMIIEEPCDSAGILRDFLFEFGIGNNRGEIQGSKGKLYLSFQLDSVRQTMEKEYRRKYEKDSVFLSEHLRKKSAEQTIVVKKVWPWWLYVILLAVGVLLGLNILNKFKII